MDEFEQFKKYLLDLNCKAKGSIQYKTVEEVLCSLYFRTIGARIPRGLLDEDGVYHLIWAFKDSLDVTFAIEIDSNGVIEWFFRDRLSNITAGTDDGDEINKELPDIARVYFEKYTNQSREKV